MRIEDYWGVKKGKKIKTIDFKPMHFKLDTDKDKVPDWKDCQPFNPFKQDAYSQRGLLQNLNQIVGSFAQFLNSVGFNVLQVDGGTVNQRTPYPVARFVIQSNQDVLYRLFAWARDVGFTETRMEGIESALFLKAPSYILILYEMNNAIILEIYPPFADSVKASARGGVYEQYIDQTTWSSLVNLAINEIANSMRSMRI